MIWHKLLFAIVLMQGALAHAGLIFEQPWPGLGSGSIKSDPTNPAQQAADNFRFTKDTKLTAIEWHGSYCDPSNIYCGTYPRHSNTSFIIRVFEDTGGKPDTSPFYPEPAPYIAQVTVSLTDLGAAAGFRHFALNAELPEALLLHANTTYWLSLLDKEPDAVTHFNWAYSTQGGELEGMHWRRTDGDPWHSGNGNLAFSLYGHEVTVPEPTTLALTGLGLAGIGWRRRKAA